MYLRLFKPPKWRVNSPSSVLKGMAQWRCYAAVCVIVIFLFCSRLSKHEQCKLLNMEVILCIAILTLHHQYITCKWQKYKGCHRDNFAIAGCYSSCQDNKLRCSRTYLLTWTSSCFYDTQLEHQWLCTKTVVSPVGWQWRCYLHC